MHHAKLRMVRATGDCFWLKNIYTPVKIKILENELKLAFSKKYIKKLVLLGSLDKENRTDESEN